MNTGVIFAILTILFFGSWPVPTKTLKIDPRIQAFWLTVGHFLLSLVIFLFVAEPISLAETIGPFIAGVLWSIGIISGYIGIKHLGITRALGIWIPIVLVISALWGLIFFGEAKALGLGGLVQTVLAIVLLIIAALLIISSSKGEKKLGNLKIGILSAVVIGLIHGSFFVPLRTSDLPIFVTFLPLTLGMVAVTSLVILFNKLKLAGGFSQILRMISAGFVLGGGNYTALLTVQYLGVAQGYPLTQLGIIVNTLWGVLVFKEVNTFKGKVLVAIGVIVAIIGAIALNSAKS